MCVCVGVGVGVGVCVHASSLTCPQFTILLVWMLAVAGGVLVDSSLQVYQGAEPQVDWNIMLAGSLLLTIFGVGLLVSSLER